MPQHASNGSPVTGVCIRCGRQPRAGETYGTGPKAWDFTNFCPECWDDAFEGDDS